MLNSKFPPLNLTHLSLAMVGLMWVLPFLHYRHQYPLTTFDQEWWSALLGMLAASVLLENWRQAQIPRIVQLPIALIGLVLLQAEMGMMAYFDQALLYILYLLFALLLMVLGARLRDGIGLEKLSVVLAIFLLSGTELSALIGVLQHYRWHTPFDSVVVVKAASVVYGNLAQTNHFANYIALGLISLGLLLQQYKLPKGYVVLLAIPLLFVMTLSGSRSSWLYLAMISVLAGCGGRSMRSLLYYCLLLLAGFALMHGIVQLPFMAGAGDINTLQRFSGADAFGGIRLYLWHEAWLMFTQSPWLGSGFGQFAWQHFQLGPQLQRSNLTGLYNNAHNLVFQMAAEAGIAGLAVLFVSLGVWSFGLRRIAMSAAHWWGYALLGVLAIHSLLEYPLWYAYFLAIAAILLGALDETRYSSKWNGVGRMTAATIVLLGFLSLMQMKIGYQMLKDTLAIRPESAASALARTSDGLVAVHNVPLLAPYAELFMSSSSIVSQEQIGAKLALNGRVMRFIPTAQVVYRQAFLLAQDGQFDQARQLFEQARWSYPADVDAHQQLVKLAEKDPAHFAALLEFALQTEQEQVSAIYNK